MDTLIIIPARYDAQRFPGKLLADLEGKTVLERTMDRCRTAECTDRVIVATDDERIRKEVERIGGEAVLTRPGHHSGTERCAEALASEKEGWDLLINVQGDEPFILPEQIDRLAALFGDPGPGIGTLACRNTDNDAFEDPNRVKVVFAPDGRSLYFSRAPLPYDRNNTGQGFFQHIGIYAFRAHILQEITTLERTPLEQMEGLEQLRWLEHGYDVHVALSKGHHPGIDDPSDLERARKEVRDEDGMDGNGSA